MNLQALEPLIGEWATSATLPGADKVVRGRTTFEWLEGGGYLIQRSTADDPVFPRGVMVVGPEVTGERIVQHYFDSRGVARVYEVSFENGVLRFWREDPDDFSQRYTGHLNADATVIDGAWELRNEGETWQHDFELSYTKVT